MTSSIFCCAKHSTSYLFVEESVHVWNRSKGYGFKAKTKHSNFYSFLKKIPSLPRKCAASYFYHKRAPLWNKTIQGLSRVQIKVHFGFGCCENSLTLIPCIVAYICNNFQSKLSIIIWLIILPLPRITSVSSHGMALT